MKDAETLIRHLQQYLDQASSAKTKVWWEMYLKGVIPFLIVRILGIREQIVIFAHSKLVRNPSVSSTGYISNSKGDWLLELTLERNVIEH